jgi:hypothetical protein
MVIFTRRPLCLREEKLGAYLIGSLVGPTAILGVLEKILLSLSGFVHRTVHPVAQASPNASSITAKKCFLALQWEISCGPGIKTTLKTLINAFLYWNLFFFKHPSLTYTKHRHWRNVRKNTLSGLCLCSCISVTLRATIRLEPWTLTDVQNGQ